MKSVLISYNFTSETQHDIYRLPTEKDTERFLTRMRNDRKASPNSEIHAFRLNEDGTSEKLE